MLGINKTVLILATPKHQDKPPEIMIFLYQNMMGWFIKILSKASFHGSMMQCKIEELHFPPLQTSTPTYGRNTLWPGE